MPRDLDGTFWHDLSELIPETHPVVLDLGAHQLEEACQLMPMLAHAIWHAFEPNPECWAHVERHVLPYLGMLGEIHLHKAAVGAVPGTTLLYRSSKTDGGRWTASSSTKRPKGVLAAFPWMKFDNGIEVPVVTLDNTCDQIGKIDLIKMDIQGAEIDAIAGGHSTFARAKYVLTEVVGYEEYEGQVGLDGLIAALPGRWHIKERLSCDALLENLDAS